MKKTLLACILLSGCGNNSESQVNWGRLANGGPSFIEANTLLICGDSNLRKVANDALWEWNFARGKRHALASYPSCLNKRNYEASLEVLIARCAPNVVGWHTQGGNHHVVAICQSAQTDVWRRVMLHEIGHAFGLCDQYSPGNAGQIEFHPNCGWPRSILPARSIMGGLYSGSPSELTPDDVAGIRFLQGRNQ